MLNLIIFLFHSVKASDKQIEELFQQIGPIDHVEIFPKDKYVRLSLSF